MNDRSPSKAAPHHWLIAAWPGMSGVAQTSAAHLIRTLSLRPAGELAPHDHFDIQAVQVKDGLIGKPSLPKNSFFTGELPGSSDKVTVFFGEAQPAAGAYGFAHELLTRAKEMGVDRLATFASFASQMHPAADPSVFAAGTHRELVEEATVLGAKSLTEAQIGGLNGVLLGAAMHRGIPGLCLLGEVPFFGVKIQNPKAAKHVLELFGRLSGATLDTSELDAQSHQIETVLLQLLDRMQAGPNTQNGSPAVPEFEVNEASDEEIARSAEDEAPSKRSKPDLDRAALDRIEHLFIEAGKDRAKSASLKHELDANGVFARYENRFLDLFRQAN